MTNSLFILFAILLSSCNRQSADSSYAIDFFACENEENDEDGFLSRNGKFFSIDMDDIIAVTPIINGYCVINYTLYKVGENLSDTIPIAHDVEYNGVMNDGLIPICKTNEHISIIDTKGHEVAKLKEFDKKEVLGCYSYSDSKLRVVLEDNSYVYVDKSGDMLFGSRFAWGTDFKAGHAVVQNIKQNSDLYSFVDDTATPIFTFESEDNEYICISNDLELLSAKENDIIVIYDFEGNRVLQCPSKVRGIYAFCQDGFIYYNEDEKFGLMSYEGTQLIRSKYEQLIPNGQRYLALTDDEESVRLIDAKDNMIREYDGEEIYDFRHKGFDYPTLIESSDDRYLMIGVDGEVIANDLNIDFDSDDIGTYNIVMSDYFPEEQVVGTVMDLCKRGHGLSNRYGAFFNSASHCYTKDISFLSSYSAKALEGHNRARKEIATGINYDIDYDVVFDEPIVRNGASSLSTSAWLQRVELYVYMPDMYRNQAFLNRCVNEMINNGCTLFYNKKTDYILYSSNKELIYVIVHNWEKRKYEFAILMMPNTESNRNMWRTYLYDHNK